MPEKFDSLESEKRERILNAAISEFAFRGYEKASTNEIVKNAQISKGLLFHYFGNKKQLFLFLYDYCIGLFSGEVMHKIERDQRDLFQLMRQSMSIKIELMEKYPEIIKFVEEAYLETAPGIREEIEKRNLAVIQMNIAELFRSVDTSGFKDGLSLEQVINIITFTSEGLTNVALKRSRLTKQNVDYPMLAKEAESYLDLFEKLFYKEVKRS